jgi:hypothetical protein
MSGFTEPRTGQPLRHALYLTDHRWRPSTHKSPGSATGCAGGSGASSGSKAREWILRRHRSTVGPAGLPGWERQIELIRTFADALSAGLAVKCSSIKRAPKGCIAAPRRAANAGAGAPGELKPGSLLAPIAGGLNPEEPPRGACGGSRVSPALPVGPALRSPTGSPVDLAAVGIGAMKRRAR